MAIDFSSWFLLQIFMIPEPESRKRECAFALDMWSFMFVSNPKS